MVLSLTPLPATTYGGARMERSKDYYGILGVPRDASPAAIERAYEQLARRLRPRAGRAFGPTLREVQQAYEVLRDATRRRSYDSSLGEPDGGRFAALSWPFAAAPVPGALRRAAVRATLSGEILLTPDEAAAGGTLSLDMPVVSDCGACRRTGGRAADCGRCGGEGRVQRRLPVVVRVPAGVREGAVFQMRVAEPDVAAVLLTVHVTVPR